MNTNGATPFSIETFFEISAKIRIFIFYRQENFTPDDLSLLFDECTRNRTYL